jgi:hypothetical protein
VRRTWARREPAIAVDAVAAVTVKDLMYVEEGMATSELLMDTPLAAIEVKVYVF